ncbi:hypothetical protein GDO81_004434 [Engystomops pustulosus]|uniref:Uncharacterized protein n=1 Tax=Engystomops pustulosus TaxID=76066 RepID=A0AAV6ZS22_ENGPU|nr:hypothetical protein GDO81_004434 [Engystomops pustulosus]
MVCTVQGHGWGDSQDLKTLKKSPQSPLFFLHLPRTTKSMHRGKKSGSPAIQFTPRAAALASMLHFWHI